MNNPLTLAIITQRRPQQLTRLLESVKRQSVQPQRIIIIDNDAGAGAHTVASAYKKTSSLTYTLEPKANMPRSRNLAMKLCRTPLLGFTDDDCVLDPQWVKEAAIAAHAHKQATFFMGQSRLLNQHNIYAQAQHYRQRYWFFATLNTTTRQVGRFSLDTKNVILRRNVLVKRHIYFDESLFSQPIGDHSDTDLGLQIAKDGLVGYYIQSMIVHHEDVSELSRFVKKAYWRGHIAFLIYTKWRLTKELVFIPDIKLTKWLRRLKCWPEDFINWTTGLPDGQVNRLIVFILMKLYDRAYLHGFANQARLMGKRFIICGDESKVV